MTEAENEGKYPYREPIDSERIVPETEQPMNDFDLNDLRLFGLIASTEGLSSASRRFGIPKASLSRALHRLEQAAGAPLFDRVNRGLRLTPLGTSLLPTAEAAVSLMLDADEALRVSKEEPQGPLRIAVSALSGQTLLAPVIARLARNHPKVRTELKITSGGPDPVAEQLDVVIRIGRPSEPYLVSRRIISSPLALYTLRAQTRDGALERPEDVEALGRIVTDVDDVARDWVLRNRKGHEIRMTSEPLILLSDPSVALSLLSAGTGVAFLPRLYADPLVRDGTLVRALSDYTGPEVELYASLPPRRSSVPAVRAFLDLLVQHTARLERARHSEDLPEADLTRKRP
ncbi:LysR family transcriptional regulator [Fodinicurvata fenggangensis]|uniref:LysR family transcriptional regulator n=1 Tax=Fodinicurvata fenggangensis TaxID=1121830 RepID=UPI000479D437|nr:LysR family transcriptional regulator [Fodinicurvata fenggangensis]